MKKLSKVVALLLAAVLLFGLCACGGGNTSNTTPATNNTGNTADNTPKTKFPEKPIELIVPYTSGGACHLSGEMFAKEAAAVLGQPITVTCMPGGGGVVGANYVFTQKHDGYTLLYTTASLVVSIVNGDTDFGINDFVGIARTADNAPIIAVAANAPYNNVSELIEWCKAHPGEFTLGNPGAGSYLQLAGLAAMNAIGVGDVIKDVPYGGTSEVVADVLGGHISAVSCNISGVKEHIAAGTMKLIIVSGEERFADYPNVPTLKEQGYNCVLSSWRGCLAPADVPQEILDALDKAAEKMIATDTFYEASIKLGEPRAYKNMKDFTDAYKNDYKVMKEILDSLNK